MQRPLVLYSSNIVYSLDRYFLEDPTLAINDPYILMVASTTMTFRVGSSWSGQRHATCHPSSARAL